MLIITTMIALGDDHDGDGCLVIMTMVFGNDGYDRDDDDDYGDVR